MSYLGGRTIYIDSDGNEHFDYERDYEPKPITNADRIRAMTDEELSDFIIGTVQRGGYTPSKEPLRWIEWLKQEVTE